MNTITVEVADGIATMTLSREGVLNAFTLEMGEEFVEAIEEADDDAGVRAVIVTGAGGAFCAGMDLTADDLFRWDEDEREPGGKLALAILACRKPVIAAINGPAVGIGATMTLSMDARLASTRARIGFVFAKLGITPEAASSFLLPRLVGMANALDLMYSGDVVTAPRAREVGLVSSVHTPEDLLPAARALADRWTLDRSPHAIALTRQLVFRHRAQTSVWDAHLAESRALHSAARADGAEGARAFLAKETPRFTAPQPSAEQVSAILDGTEVW